MAKYTLLIDKCKYEEILRHLHPGGLQPYEEAAFLFCEEERGRGEVSFVPKDVELLAPTAFKSRSDVYLELTDNSRGSLIKRAHDLGSCLVEVHAHPRQVEAEFSWSDFRGFEVFVPHVRWRLKQLPYVAMVFGPKSFDSLVWDEGEHPCGTCQISVDGAFLQPTGKSYAVVEVS